VTVVVLYLILFGLAVLAFGLLVPAIIKQSTHILASAGRSAQAVSGSMQSLQEFSQKYGLAENFQAGVQSVQEQLSKTVEGLVSTLTDVFGGLVGLIVVLVMAFYMVVQDEEARRAFDHLVPTEYRELMRTILAHVQDKMSRWLIGQLSLCLIIGVMYFIGLSIIGVDAALVLALFAGITELVPYLGPILGSIPVLILAYSVSPFTALLAFVLVVFIQQVEGHVIVPKVMQKAVGINPLLSIIALLVGAKLFGIVGALMSIPVATAITAVLSELYRHRQQMKSDV
jgi:predicted PurR-regulated permease PerM